MCQTHEVIMGKKSGNARKAYKKRGCRVTAFTVPGMYYEKVYLILTGLHSVIEPHFAGFFHAFSLSQIVDVYKEVVSKLCQQALYPVEDRVLVIICSQPFSLTFWLLQIVLP